MARRAAPGLLLSLLALVGASCSSGKDGGPCGAGQVLCGGCYDPARYQTDASNCGGCGIQCGPGATCSGGSCVCGPGTTLCSRLSPRCRDLQTDDSACGSCDVSCTVQEVGWTCEAGACGCFGDRTECGTICTDTANDPNNCGIGKAGCANACLSKQLCVSGQCECPPDLPTACATTCANTQNDPANCGSCGRTCDLGEEICSGALCQCPPLLPDRCPTSGLPASCVSMASDPQNCGKCGNACATGATCSSGTCSCPTGESVCNDTCVPCAAGAACCPSGSCQTQHSNGIGQFYFDCNPPYVPAATTLDAAQRAAAAWSATGTNTLDVFCGSNCLSRDNGAGLCATWCFGLSSLAGHVGGPGNQGCALACPNASSPQWN